MKGLVLAFALVSVLMLLLGCTGQQKAALPPSDGKPQGQAANEKTPMPGSDRDAHGCIPSAGYTWCDALSQCVRPWEVNCTKPSTPAAPITGEKEGAPANNSTQMGKDDNLPELKLPPQKCTMNPESPRCFNDRDEKIIIRDARGVGTGDGKEIVQLKNKGDATANCTLEFIVTSNDDPSIQRHAYYWAVLAAGESSEPFEQGYRYNEERIETKLGGQYMPVCENVHIVPINRT
jgi:hypothetical protein